MWKKGKKKKRKEKSFLRLSRNGEERICIKCYEMIFAGTSASAQAILNWKNSSSSLSLSESISYLFYCPLGDISSVWLVICINMYEKKENVISFKNVALDYVSGHVHLFKRAKEEEEKFVIY